VKAYCAVIPNDFDLSAADVGHCASLSGASSRDTRRPTTQFIYSAPDRETRWEMIIAQIRFRSSKQVIVIFQSRPLEVEPVSTRRPKERFGDPE
jgi:hypothetical protein